MHVNRVLFLGSTGVKEAIRIIWPLDVYMQNHIIKIECLLPK